MSSWLLTFLLNALWQVPLIALLAAVLDRLLRRTPAQGRHWLWVGALVLSLLVPLSGGSALISARAERMWQTTRLSGAGAAGPRWSEALRSLHLSRFAEGLAGLYALFLGVRLVGLARALRRTRALRQAAVSRELPPPLRAALARAEAALGVRGAPVLITDQVPGPVTVGHRRPAILLPEALLAAEEADVLLCALGHELAHIRRRDFAGNLLCELLLLPISFHPAAAFLRRRVTTSREQACDELVVRSLLSPKRYARSLLHLARAAVAPRPAVYTLGVLCAHSLEVRIMSLLDPRSRSSAGPGRIWAGLCLALLGVGGALGAACSLRLPGDDPPAAAAPPSAASPAAAPRASAQKPAPAGSSAAEPEEGPPLVQTGGAEIHLPDAVKVRYRGGEVTGEYEVCLDSAGRVSSVRIETGIPGADQSIMDALRTWTFQPPPMPLCLVKGFRFIVE